MASTGKLHDLSGGMKMSQIENTINQLARSQGFYGRMAEGIRDMKKYDKPAYNKLKKEWEGKKYKDPVDFVMDIES